MEQYYTDERNVQILISLLKEHGIKRVVASPGSTNVTFVGSLQQDPYFEMYSCVDERSAAYMAVGMAAETGEPVVLSCTGATASRNYYPALTEAYYRQLPILAVTSTQEESKIGHMLPQVIDRRQQPFDTVRMSVHMQTVKDEDDEWNCVVKANTAILELNHHGMGPVHINLTTRYSRNFKVKELAPVRKITRHGLTDELPDLPKCKMAVYVGTHLRWSQRLTKAVDAFCEAHNAVVFSDPASNYNGKYRVNNFIRSSQPVPNDNASVDLLIHIGTMSDMAGIVRPKNVWRVSEDGLIADRYKVLKRVFEMPEVFFFEHYSQNLPAQPTTYYDSCRRDYNETLSVVPSLPLSHIWCASQLYDKLPKNGLGAEFHLFKQLNLTYVNGIEKYLSAGGHYGRKSPDVIKHLATDLGFEYMTASTKEEFNSVYDRFITPEMTDKPMLFEVFTEVQDEDKALYDLWHIMKDTSVKGLIKKGVKEVLGEEMTKKVKGMIKK